MRRTLSLTLVLGLVASLAWAGAAPAPAPSAPLAQVPKATLATTPADSGDGDAASLDLLFSPLAGAQERVVLCSPQTIYFCVNQSCQCSRFTCARCGVKSFTCNESTHQFSCVCKTC